MEPPPPLLPLPLPALFHLAEHDMGERITDLFMVFFIMFCCILCVAYSIHVHTRMSAIEKNTVALPTTVHSEPVFENG
jgi:hypothetical protein